ncbi:MAG: 50S ribosomal protein L18 [Candidatus Omnitrophica bacterium]|nr:50S ribosomal protein L18 [Candidatus Omnitrophota bacterium]MDD5591778.1 50S ribosomal protein L18 [Candidatus Omnitrophota bacterium]
MKKKKDLSRLKRHRRIRLLLSGTKERPRLILRRSLKNIYAQIIDDTKNATLFSLSTLDKEIKQKFASAGNLKAAELFGEVFAKKAKEKGINSIVFDRAGYLYHGRVKAFADALRKGGMEF